MRKKVLFVGESWSATLMEVKGFNSFYSSKYETGLGWIDKAIEKAGYELVTPIIITNSQQFMDIIVKKKDVVTANDQVLAII